MPRPELAEIAPALRADIQAAATAYLESSGLGLETMPEYLLQGWIFATRHADWTMSMETPISKLLDWHRANGPIKGRVDLAIYDSTAPAKSAQPLIAIVEFKLGWVDLWKDIFRTRDLLVTLAKKSTAPRLAIVAGVAKREWANPHSELIEAFGAQGWDWQESLPFRAANAEAEPDAEYVVMTLCNVIHA